jgi:hypothetical protein
MTEQELKQAQAVWDKIAGLLLMESFSQLS